MDTKKHMLLKLIKDASKSVLGSFGYELRRTNLNRNPQTEKQLTPEHFFDMYFAHINPDDFFFVQIGANDGKSRDMLHQYVVERRLPGILVEPQRDIFERLIKTYSRHTNLQFANVAIAPIEGLQDFYKVKDSFIHKDNYFETTAIASFDREVFRKTLARRIGKIIECVSDDLDDYTEIVQEDTLSFGSLVRKYDIQKIDFLFLDCEGYDYEIIKMVDFTIFSPSIINFESKFLSDRDRAACEELLMTAGYQVFRHGNDTCAFK